MQTEPYVTEEVLENIRRFLSDKPTENGGAVMSRDGAVVRFIPDMSPLKSGKLEYAPNVDKLNREINKLIETEGLEFAGFVHSHPNNSLMSREDEKYMHTILDALSADSILCGVFNTATAELRWYEVTK